MNGDLVISTECHCFCFCFWIQINACAVKYTGIESKFRPQPQEMSGTMNAEDLEMYCWSQIVLQHSESPNWQRDFKVRKIPSRFLCNLGNKAAAQEHTHTQEFVILCDKCTFIVNFIPQRWWPYLPN